MLMKTLNCIIIEDEPIAREILRDYIHQVPDLNLLQEFEDALFAVEYLHKNKVDVIFLDLHLPKMKGFQFLKTLTHKPQIIVTTAYHQYALEAFELEVVDYLLKPFEFQRFLKAVNKLKKPRASSEGNGIKSNARKPHLFFNVNRKMVRINLEDILYIESLKEYVRIHLRDGSIMTKFQIGEMERKLNPDHFLRIHRSYLIAKDKISAFKVNSIEIGPKELPIGRSYKHVVMGELQKDGLRF